MDDKKPSVYIISNHSHSTIYVGVTSDLPKRMMQHKNHSFGGFSARYNLVQLLYFEGFGNMNDAIAREKQIKSWSRSRKDKLISEFNPSWRDLFSEE